MSASAETAIPAPAMPASGRLQALDKRITMGKFLQNKARDGDTALAHVAYVLPQIVAVLHAAERTLHYEDGRAVKALGSAGSTIHTHYDVDMVAVRKHESGICKLCDAMDALKQALP